MEGNRDEQYMKQALQLAQKGRRICGAQSNGRSCHCKRRSHHRKWIPRTLWRTACGSKCHCRCQRRCGRCNHVCYFRAMFSLWGKRLPLCRFIGRKETCQGCRWQFRSQSAGSRKGNTKIKRSRNRSGKRCVRGRVQTKSTVCFVTILQPNNHML